MGLMFAGIFITVWLTGGRDLDAFSQTDWVLLSVMGVLEAAICAGLFYVADKCGKQLLPIEWLKYRLRSAAIVSQPLPSNIICESIPMKHFRAVLWFADCPMMRVSITAHKNG